MRTIVCRYLAPSQGGLWGGEGELEIEQEHAHIVLRASGVSLAETHLFLDVGQAAALIDALHDAMRGARVAELSVDDEGVYAR